MGFLWFFFPSKLILLWQNSYVKDWGPESFSLCNAIRKEALACSGSLQNTSFSLITPRESLVIMVSNDFCNIHSAKQGCSLGQHVFMCLRDQKSSTSASLPRVSVSTAMNLFLGSEHHGTKTPENYMECIKEIPHRWNVTNQHAIPHSV